MHTAVVIRLDRTYLALRKALCHLDGPSTGSITTIKDSSWISQGRLIESLPEHPVEERVLGVESLLLSLNKISST